MINAEIEEIQVFLERIKSERFPSTSSTGSTSTTSSTSTNTTSSTSAKGNNKLPWFRSSISSLLKLLTNLPFFSISLSK